MSSTELLDGVDVAVVRILGGYRAWQDGIDAVVASGMPTVVVSGEQAPDAELMSHSTVPAGVALQTHVYLAQGGVENLRQLHAFLCDTLLMTGFGFAPPAATPTWGVLERPAGNVATDDGPTRRGALLPRPASGGQHRLRRRAVPRHRRRGRAARCRSTARRCAPPEPELLELLGTADAMVTTVLAAGGAVPATVAAGGADDTWNVAHLAALDIPILQGLCLTSLAASSGATTTTA